MPGWERDTEKRAPTARPGFGGTARALAAAARSVDCHLAVVALRTRKLGFHEAIAAILPPQRAVAWATWFSSAARGRIASRALVLLRRLLPKLKLAAVVAVVARNALKACVERCEQPILRVVVQNDDSEVGWKRARRCGAPLHAPPGRVALSPELRRDHAWERVVCRRRADLHNVARLAARVAQRRAAPRTHEKEREAHGRHQVNR